MIEALFDGATGLTLVKGDVLSFEEAIGCALSGGRFPTKTHYDSLSTFIHETTHFYQAISTNFFYSYALDLYFNIFPTLKEIMVCNRAGNVRKGEIFLQKMGKLLCSGSPVRNIEVIEGSAVFNAYRTCTYKPTHEGFLRYLENQHKKQEKYKNAYCYASKIIGEATFELFAPLCFIALQAQNPGTYFAEALLMVREKMYLLKPYFFSLDERARKSPLPYLLTILEMSEEERFLPYAMKHPVVEHPILAPYFRYITTICETAGIPIWLIEDILIRPYDYVLGYNARCVIPRELIEFLFRKWEGSTGERFVIVNDFNQYRLSAPVRVHCNPKVAETMRGSLSYTHPVSVVRTGLGIELDEYNIYKNGLLVGFDQNKNPIFIEYSGTYTDLVLTMAALGVVYDTYEEGILLCPHKNCPVYKTKFCRRYYGFPMDDYKKCKFLGISEIWVEMGGISYQYCE